MSVTEAAITTTDPNHSTPSTLPIEPKLWAGKYKSAEDLEEGYKKIANTYEENQTLKKELEKFTKVPEDYEVPSDITMRANEIAEIKNIAKNSGLTQDQFVKTAKDMQARINYQLTSFEEAKKEVGEANLNILNDYVEKHYPAKLREHVLTKLIKDKEAMSEALKHRESLLNTAAPGMSEGDAGKTQKYDGHKELSEAAAAYHKNPHDRKAKDRYIKLAGEVGNERFGKK